MKYNILNFAQGLLLQSPAIIENNVDIYDLHFLEWFSDFSQNDKMLRKNIREDGYFTTYFWIDFEYVAEQFPFFNLKPHRIARRFEKMERAGLVKRKIVSGKDEYISERKEKVRYVHGRKTYYALTQGYYDLRSATMAQTAVERERRASFDQLINDGDC